MTGQHYGATLEEWGHFIKVVGAKALLPVICNPSARISPDSTLSDVGKSPSRYNAKREVVGLGDWTNHSFATDIEKKYRHEPDCGIGVQGHVVRAIDVDFDDPVEAEKIRQAIKQHLGVLPERTRANTGRFLVAFRLKGFLHKDVIQSDGGAIELLGNGQQFVAAGQHKSGSRYSWGESLPPKFPFVSLEALQALWTALGGGPLDTSRPTVKAAAKISAPLASTVIHEGGRNDFLWREACALRGRGWDESQISNALTDLNRAKCCPPLDDEIVENMAQRVAENYAAGTPNEWTRVSADEFKPLTDVTRPYVFVPDHISIEGPPVSWLIKGVLPKADKAIVYGPYGSRKSFLVYDMLAVVAQQKSWRGIRTNRARVAWVCGEGAADFRNRKKAYAKENGGALPGFIDLMNAPNLLNASVVNDVIAELKAAGGCDVLALDTLAAVSAGANESSSEDMGLLMENAGRISRAVGCMTLFIGHPGKDESKGIRGWSGLGGAMDAIISVELRGDTSVATVVKQKGGVAGAQFAFKVRAVELGRDEDGDAITSCVVEHIFDTPRAPAKAPAKTPEYTRLIRAVMAESGGVDGRITVRELYDGIKKRKVVEPGKRDLRNQRITEAINRLTLSGELSSDDLSIWINSDL
jgi:hypothetical protein